MYKETPSAKPVDFERTESTFWSPCIATSEIGPNQEFSSASISLNRKERRRVDCLVNLLGQNFGYISGPEELTRRLTEKPLDFSPKDHFALPPDVLSSPFLDSFRFPSFTKGGELGGKLAVERTARVLRQLGMSHADNLLHFYGLSLNDLFRPNPNHPALAYLKEAEKDALGAFREYLTDFFETTEKPFDGKTLKNYAERVIELQRADSLAQQVEKEFPNQNLTGFIHLVDAETGRLVGITPQLKEEAPGLRLEMLWWLTARVSGLCLRSKRTATYPADPLFGLINKQAELIDSVIKTTQQTKPASRHRPSLSLTPAKAITLTALALANLAGGCTKPQEDLSSSESIQTCQDLGGHGLVELEVKEKNPIVKSKTPSLEGEFGAVTPKDAGPACLIREEVNEHGVKVLYLLTQYLDSKVGAKLPCYVPADGVAYTKFADPMTAGETQPDAPMTAEKAQFFKAKQQEILGLPTREMSFLTASQFTRAFPNIQCDFSEANEHFQSDLDPYFNATLFGEFFGLSHEEVLKETKVSIILDGSKNWWEVLGDPKIDQAWCKTQFDQKNNRFVISLPLKDLYGWMEEAFATRDAETIRGRVDDAKTDLNNRIQNGVFDGMVQLLAEKGYLTPDQAEKLKTSYFSVVEHTVSQFTDDESWRNALFAADYNMTPILVHDPWRDVFKQRLFLPSPSLLERIKRGLGGLGIGTESEEDKKIMTTVLLEGITVSAAKGEIAPENCPSPLDLGTAMLLADLHHPRYERELLPAITDHFVQTTARFQGDPSQKLIPHEKSYWDYVRLSDQCVAGDDIYRVNRQPDGKINYEEVGKKTTITLKDGSNITGYLVSREAVTPDQVGLLRRIWMTIPPEKGKSPEDLVKEIGKFHIITDGERAITFDSASDSSFLTGSSKGSLFGYYSRSAFVYHLPVGFEKTLEIVFEGPGLEGSGVEENLLCPLLWYRVEGVKLRRDRLPPDIPLQASWTNHPDLRGDYGRFFNQLAAVDSMVVKEKFPESEVIDISPEKGISYVDRRVGSDHRFRLSIQSDSWQMLDGCSVEITYPGEETPAIQGTLRQILGITNTDGNRFMASRYSSLTKSPEGKLVFSLPAFPVPKDSRIVIRSPHDPAQVILETKPDSSLPSYRLRLYHFFLPMSSPAQQYVEANPNISKPIVTRQLGIFIDGYQATPVEGLWKKGVFEGNTFIVSADGSLLPISTGFEDLGDAGFYDWAIKSVDKEDTLPLATNLFCYGHGQFAGDNAVVDSPENAWAWALNSSMSLVLRPGDKIRVDPYCIRGREAANVAITLWAISE